MPLVSVLMAVLNGEDYVEIAIRSMINQSLFDIEIIVVDDGSTDRTPQILERLMREDSRLRVERSPVNLGPAGAANLGLAIARSDLIARMDSDDISHPNRLEIQREFMERNADVGLIGTSIQQIDARGRVTGTSYRPRDSFSTSWIGQFNYPISHPSSMFRRNIPGESPLIYDESYRTTMDYEFYARAQKHAKVVSLPEMLLKYRVHPKAISQSRRTEQLHAARKIAERLQRDRLPPEVVKALAPFNDAFLGQRPQRAADIFGGLRAVISYDVERRPDRKRWIMRQAAMLAFMALSRSGLKSTGMLRAFTSSGRDFLPALTMKFAETRSLLPGPLTSHPKV